VGRATTLGGSFHADRSRRRPTRAVVALAIVLLSAASCGGSDSGSDLKGVPWRWSAVLHGSDPTGLSRIPDPTNYLLRFDEDGTFVGRADCKSVAGEYRLSGSELTLEVRPSANGACGEGSRAAEYTALLRRVVSYDVYDEGSLALGLAEDAGQMYFYAPTE